MECKLKFIFFKKKSLKKEKKRKSPLFSFGAKGSLFLLRCGKGALWSVHLSPDQANPYRVEWHAGKLEHCHPVPASEAASLRWYAHACSVFTHPPTSCCISYELTTSRENIPSWTICSWGKSKTISKHEI